MASEYRLTGRVEGGELAELYRAECEGRGVVVKLFHQRTSVKAYAQHIAETIGKLKPVQHPGIARVLDIGFLQRRLAIVREDIARYTLGQALQRLNTKEVVLTATLAMSLVLELVDAVNEAHQAGVVHGALTPGNVLLGHDGRPAASDFGALAALSAVPELRQHFVERGRSSYRAPELLKGEPITVACDVFSLGAVTYELLTLRAASSESAQVSTRRDAIPPPSRLDRRLNSRIDPIVMRALDPVPGRRFRTLPEFGSALREYLAANGGLPPRDELRRFVDQLFPKEVELQDSAAVPFSGPVALVGVEGVELDASEDRSIVVTPRGAFSAVVDTLPDGMADEVPSDALTPKAFDLDGNRPTDWHAPQGAMPAQARSGPKEAPNASVLKRVRRIEDFESVKPGSNVDDTQPMGQRLEAAEPVERKAAAAVPAVHRAAEAPTPGPAESQPLALDNSIVGPDGKRRRMITEERNLALADRRRKKWIPIVAGSALAAVAFLLLGLSRWSSGGAVAPYEGQPVQRPRPLPVKRPSPPPTSAPRPEPQPKGPVVDNCYAGPKKGVPVGYLSISATRSVAVVIDGDTVCGSYARVPVGQGQRKIVVIDTRTKEAYEQVARVEAGKVIRLIPLFKGK